MDQSRVPLVIFDTPLKPTGNIKLLQLPDGSLAIMHDGTLIEGCHFAPHQLEASVIAFRKQVALAADPPKPG